MRFWYGVAVLMFGAGSACGDPIQQEIAITVPANTTVWRPFVRSTQFTGTGTHTLELDQEIIYGLAADRNLLLLIPMVSKSMRVGGTDYGAAGLGDVTALIKQQLWKRNRLQVQDRLGLIGGIKVPTGATSASAGPGGVPRQAQVGTGSFDFPLGIQFAHDAPRGFFADLISTITTEALDYRFGNILHYDLAYTHRIKGGEPREHFIWGVLELNGTLTGQNRSLGTLVRNTGGHVLYLSPGTRLVHWTGRIVLELSYQIPIVTDFIGNQAAPTGSWLAGLRLTL